MNDDKNKMIILNKLGIIKHECLFLMEVDNKNKIVCEPIIFILN